MPWDGARDSDRPTYDDAAKDAAARFLYAEMNPQPRIRGLETVAQCRAWLAVETDRDAPRPAIVAALNERLAALRDGDAEPAGTADAEVSA